MQLPDPDSSIIARREEIIAAMRAIVPPLEMGNDAAHDSVIVEETELRAYESDALTAYKQMPLT